MPPIPDPEIIARVQAGFTSIFSRVDIYEADAATLWMADAPVIDGSVSVDATRDERRTANITFSNADGNFKSRPENGFWYDKVIKVFRGIYGHSNYILDDMGDPILDDMGDPILDETTFLPDWETQIGEFFIDDIDLSRFPSSTGVTMRDGTKKLLQAKFAQSTEFASGVSIESIVYAVALAGGIPSNRLTRLPSYGAGPGPTGVNTERVHLYDRTTERWAAIKEIGEIYGYDIFFDYEGFLYMEPFSDPADAGLSPSVFTFEVGGRNVKNASMNEQDPVSLLPEWWSAFQHTTPAPVLAMETGGQQRSGDGAILIPTTTGAMGGSIASQSIPVEVGDVYEVSAWSKADVAANGKYLTVTFDTVENSLSLASRVDLVSNATFTTEYTEDVGQVTVPAGMTWMRVALYNWTGTAKRAWWDDVFVERVYPIDDIKGNLVSYAKKTVSSRIYNHVVVTGESSATIPSFGEAENNEPTSPTRIARLGRRTFFYSSALITNDVQAADTAARFLSVMALESFEIGFESIVAPWLDPNKIITFDDPDAVTTDPLRYLLSDLTIPLKPAAMQANAKRITIVGNTSPPPPPPGTLYPSATSYPSSTTYPGG